MRRCKHRKRFKFAIESEFERAQRRILRSDQEFAAEGGFGGTAVQGFFGGDAGYIRIIIFPRDVRQDEIARSAIETIRIGQIFTDRVIGKVPGTGQHALFHNPGIRTDLQHIQIVIGFEDEALRFAEVNFHKLRHVAEVGADRDLDTVGAKRKPDGIRGIVRDGEGVNVNISDGEALAGFDGFHTVQAFAKCFGKAALERGHGRFGDVKRCFPEAKDLRKSVAVVGVFVGDEDGIEMVEIALNGSEASQGFAFAQTSVYQDASAVRFEQGDVARTAGSEYGDAQADGNSPRENKNLQNNGRAVSASQSRRAKISSEQRGRPNRHAGLRLS
jgi:hypothetical protein